LLKNNYIQYYQKVIIGFMIKTSGGLRASSKALLPVLFEYFFPTR